GLKGSSHSRNRSARRLPPGSSFGRQASATGNSPTGSRGAPADKRLAWRMQGIWLFSQVAAFIRGVGEPGQAARLERRNTGKWTHELVKHLEWRRVEELCAACFEELGFKTGTTHDRGDRAVGSSLYAAGADTA